MLADIASVEILGWVMWGALVVLHASTGIDQVDAPEWQRALLASVLPAVVLLLLVPTLNNGATVAQLATGVRPVRLDGTHPTWAQLMVRFVARPSGYFLLHAADGLLIGGTLGTLARLLGLASVLVAWRSRGLSGLAAGVTVVDARSDPSMAVPTVAVHTLEQGSGWELRRMSMAVLSLSAFAYVVLAFVGAVSDPSSTAGSVAVLLLLVVAFAGFTVGMALYLVPNGVTMVRRERRSLGNLLSLLVGFGSLALLMVAVALLAFGSGWLVVVAIAALALSGYLSFLLTAFVGYGLLYGRLLPQSGVDSVVTLGSGLLGARVSPLLASRLDRALTVFENERARGHLPLMICSGGQGPREDVTEATAMADYLRDRGIPADVLIEEDQSHSAEQNLRLSWALTRARGGRHMVAVTNDFHAFRIAIIAREIGVPARLSAHRPPATPFPAPCCANSSAFWHADSWPIASAASSSRARQERWLGWP